MKKCKFIKSGIAIAILGCSIIFTACDVNTDKKVEKQANKVVDAVESKDITKLDAIINGTDEIKADEELKDFFETDTEAKQKNGLMSKILLPIIAVSNGVISCIITPIEALGVLLPVLQEVASDEPSVQFN